MEMICFYCESDAGYSLIGVNMICFQCVIDAQTSAVVDCEGECYCCGNSLKPRRFLFQRRPQKAYLVKDNLGMCEKCFRLALNYVENFSLNNRDELNNPRLPQVDHTSRLFAFYRKK